MVLRFLMKIKLLFSHPFIVLGGNNEYSLYPLEKKVVEMLISRLPASDASILTSQLAEVNLIERTHSPKTVVAFNCIRSLEYSLGRDKKFDQVKDEYVLSKIDFFIENKKYRAVFYVVYGNFFSIEFTANMSSLMDIKDIAESHSL